MCIPPVLDVEMDLRGPVTAAAEKALATGKHTGLEVGISLDGSRGLFGFGRSSAISNTPPNGDSIFEIGSITKVFTASLLVLLKNDGLVSLEDPVRKHLGGDAKVASRNGKVIRLHQLASHNSGLPRLPANLHPRNPENPYADYSVQDLERCIAKVKLVHDPGEAYDYSNLGGGLLGHVLATSAGVS